MKPTWIAVIVLWCGTAFGQTPDVERLKQIVEDQGRRIEQLQAQLDQIQQALGVSNKSAAVVQPAVFRETRLTPPVPAPVATEVAKQTTPATVAGFRFSGDFRLRLDAAVRGASASSAGLQNIRGRYRLRINSDREVAPDVAFHMQLSTGAVNNGITFDQDFAGGVSRHPLFISEGYLDFHPSANVSIRAGKLEEVYTDNFRFLWDDDVRFNGFNERVRHGRGEFRGGQYFFVNPNVFSVTAASPLTLAGVQTGTIARASQMYHQGVSVDMPLNSVWRHQLTGDVQLYRNPNLIALTSNGAGVTATVNPGIGITVG